MADSTRVLHTDLELWATSYLRSELQRLSTRYPIAAGVEVANREPGVDALTFPEKLVVIRDDSGLTLSVVSQEKSIGVSTLAGTPENPALAKQLALLVFAIMSDCASTDPGNPVAAVTESSGPYLVAEDQPRARLYSTHTLVVTGQPL